VARAARSAAGTGARAAAVNSHLDAVASSKVELDLVCKKTVTLLRSKLVRPNNSCEVGGVKV
jgi:hypothetical protein